MPPRIPGPKTAPHVPTPAEAFANAGATTVQPPPPAEPKPRMVRVNFDIPEDVHRALRVHAAANGTTVKDLLLEHILTLTGAGRR